MSNFLSLFLIVLCAGLSAFLWFNRSLAERKPLHPSGVTYPHVPFGLEKCMYCWYIRHRGNYPEEWSSTVCVGHALWHRHKLRHRRLEKQRRPIHLHRVPFWFTERIWLLFVLLPAGIYVSTLLLRPLSPLTQWRNSCAERRIQRRDADLLRDVCKNVSAEISSPELPLFTC